MTNVQTDQASESDTDRCNQSEAAINCVTSLKTTVKVKANKMMVKWRTYNYQHSL